MDEKTLDLFTSQQMQDNLGVTIESMFYVHGEYDWIPFVHSTGYQDSEEVLRDTADSLPRGVYTDESIGDPCCGTETPCR